MSFSNKIVRLLCRSAAVRKVVHALERNHLTPRTREDIYYHTRELVSTHESILAMLAPHARVCVRPQNFFRRLHYDWQNMDRVPVVHLTTNLLIRNAFRNITFPKVTDAMLEMETAPTNNHGENCAARNVASTVLTQTPWPRNFVMYSLSGSKQEQQACAAGYRGHHQATDLAHANRRDQILEAAPELLPPSYDLRRRWIVISTDTINHLPVRERNALLANGIPLVSYTSIPIVSNPTSIDAPRVCTWNGNKLNSFVNGGGDYVDSFDNTTADVKIVHCPDGGLMLCYYDSFRDVFDSGHMYVCETPFAYVARDSKEYHLFCDAVKPEHLHPYTVSTSAGTFTCLSIRHSDAIQITDNLARVTYFYKRSELLEMADRPLSFKTKAALRRDPPKFAGIEPDYIERYKLIERMGTSTLVEVCKKAPAINVPRPPEDNRCRHRLTMLYLAILNKPHVIREFWESNDPFQQADIYDFFRDKHLLNYLPNDAQRPTFGRRTSEDAIRRINEYLK